MNRGRAFSLIEILISLALLSLGALAMFSLWIASLQAGSKASQLAAAAAVADGELSRAVRAATLDDPPGELVRFWSQDFPSTGPAFSSGSVTSGTTTFDFAVYTQTVLTGADGSNRVKQVRVEVEWMGGQRQGQGRLSTQASRLVTEPE